MAEFNITRINELNEVSRDKLDSKDLLVLYEDSGNTTNKVSIGTLQEAFLLNKSNLGVTSQYDVQDKNLTINKAGIYTDNTAIDNYIIQNGLKVFVNDDQSLSNINRLEGFSKNGKTLTVNPVITVNKDQDSFTSDKITFSGNAVSLNTEDESINIGVDIPEFHNAVPYISTDNTQAISSAVKAGENIKFSLDENNNLILTAQVEQQQIPEESQISKKSYRLKTFNLIRNAITSNYELATTQELQLQQGDIIACKLNTPYVSSTDTILSYAIVDSGVAVKFIDKYAVFVVVYNSQTTENNLLLLASDNEYSSYIESIEVGSEKIYLRTNDNQTFEALYTLPNDVVRLETEQGQPRVENGRLAKGLLPRDITYLDEEGKVPLNSLPDGVGSIVVNNQTVSLDSDDELITPDTLVISSFEGSSATPSTGGGNNYFNIIETRCSTVPNPNDDPCIVEANLLETEGNKYVTTGSLIIMHNTIDWRNTRSCAHLKLSVGQSGDSSHRVEKYIGFENTSTEDTTLPNNTITAGDTVLFFYNGEKFFILSSDDLISNTIRLSENDNNNIILEYQGKTYSIPLDNSGRNIVSKNNLLSVDINEENSNIELDIVLPENQAGQGQEDDRLKKFLNGMGDWTSITLEDYDPEDIINEATQSFLLDLFYPVGSYFETCDINFNPNDNSLWTGSGAYTWVNVNENNVVDPEDSSKLIYKWRKDLTPGYNDGNL